MPEQDKVVGRQDSEEGLNKDGVARDDAEEDDGSRDELPGVDGE